MQRGSRNEERSIVHRPLPTVLFLRSSFIAHRSFVTLRHVTAISCLLLLGALGSATPPLRVGTVTIRTLDVYSESEASRGRFYRAADVLHIDTRLSVIRKLLLFGEGEVFRPERLAETERNLRALRFIKSASVTASPPHDGVVDVTVTTQDAWSIAPETQAANRGGESTYGVSLSDTNLLGYGKEVAIKWNKGIDRNRVGVAYFDPIVNASYWNAYLALDKTTDGHERRALLRRPFFSFATPWSSEIAYHDLRRDERLFADGTTIAKFGHDHREAAAGYGLALEPSDDVANRITAGFRFERDEFFRVASHPAAVLPSDRDFRYLVLAFAHAENHFLKLNFVNKDLRYEDFNLGRTFSIETAMSPRLLGAQTNSGFMRISAADGAPLHQGSGFIIPQLSVESRLEGGLRNAIASARITFVRRSSSEHPATLVGRIAVENGWRLDRDVQFIADGLSGLRGYRLHSFAGSRSMVLNLEQRLYLGRELLQLYSPGIVAFIDAGNATSDDVRHLVHLKTDAGLGIRLGLPRTPKNLMRLDFAWAFNRDPRGRRGFLVSFSSGQAF